MRLLVSLSILIIPAFRFRRSPYIPCFLADGLCKGVPLPLADPKEKQCGHLFMDMYCFENLETSFAFVAFVVGWCRFLICSGCTGDPLYWGDVCVPSNKLVLKRP